MDKATEQLYREREKRYIDTVQLRIADRVPTSVVDEVRPENLKAMIDFTREYGRY